MIYTIGYTGIPFAQLQAFLDAHQAFLVDIRYSPRSRNPVYNQKALQAALSGRYVHVGELGNRNYKGGPIAIVDLAVLLEQYFAPDKFTLLSVADSIDTRTAAGRLVLNVLMSVAQWEREVISERTTEALAHKKSQGQRTGGVPYGFTVALDGKTLLPLAAEQAVVHRVKHHRGAGLTIRALVAQMAHEGFVGRTGKPCILGQVHKMLKAA